MAERGGFEPPVRFYPYNGLANRRFRPLSHLSVNYLQRLWQTCSTFADFLPTLETMKREQRSKSLKGSLRKAIVQIYKRERPTASGKRRTVF